MGRENCLMNTIMDGVVYCDHFDFCSFECNKIKKCPYGLDDDEEYDDEDCEDNNNDEDDDERFKLYS